MASTPTPSHPARNWRIALVVAIALALAFGGWGLWRVLSPASTDIRAQLADSEAAREQLQSEHEELQQRVATLGRSDQISREANRELQGTLAERDEEIAGLRADVAFYERLVGATAQRHGLSVHALAMQSQSVQARDGTAWHFKTTLTQNLNRGAVSAGQLTLEVEGTNGGKLQTLDWDALRQQPDSDGVAYSFKYFQQVEGDVFLPEGFSPVRVTVHLEPRSGAAIEHSFTWAEATGAAGSAATELE
ncbi:DUF6776 family protein [Lysobacter sp. F60174L2]|uniref:DUF6776 family protein n=1 Tax=Lysobacter sp. F60174L2 TaxID=3459295 RepID=UPI00403D9982